MSDYTTSLPSILFFRNRSGIPCPRASTFPSLPPVPFFPSHLSCWQTQVSTPHLHGNGPNRPVDSPRTMPKSLTKAPIGRPQSQSEPAGSRPFGTLRVVVPSSPHSYSHQRSSATTLLQDFIGRTPTTSHLRRRSQCRHPSSALCTSNISALFALPFLCSFSPSWPELWL